MGRAVAQGGVTAVEVEVGVEVIGHFQPGFFQAGKLPAVGQQLRFQGAPARFSMRVVVGIARLGVAGQRPGCFNTLATSQTSVLAVLIGVYEQTGRGLTQRQRLFQGCKHQFSGHLQGQVPAYDPP